MFFVETDFGKIHQAAVLNVIPPQKAGLIAERAVAGAYQVADGKIVEVKGSGGMSPREASNTIRKLEAQHAVAWYNAIARDTWGSGA